MLASFRFFFFNLLIGPGLVTFHRRARPDSRMNDTTTISRMLMRWFGGDIAPCRQPHPCRGSSFVEKVPKTSKNADFFPSARSPRISFWIFCDPDFQKWEGGLEGGLGRGVAARGRAGQAHAQRAGRARAQAPGPLAANALIFCMDWRRGVVLSLFVRHQNRAGAQDNLGSDVANRVARILRAREGSYACLFHRPRLGSSNYTTADLRVILAQ